MNTAPLEAFTAHCNRVPLDRRPTVWAQYVDIWGIPQGEMGVPDVYDFAQTSFALLCPWSMIPTIGSVWLVTDRIDDLQVVNLKVNFRGMFDPTWKVPYSMDDAGGMSFGEPIRDSVGSVVGAALTAAKQARRGQTLWDGGHTVGSLVPLVQEMLER